MSVSIELTWPQLGRPHFPAGPPGPAGRIRVLPPGAVRVVQSPSPAQPDPEQVREAVRAAYAGKLALSPTGGAAGTRVPIRVGRPADALLGEGGVWISEVPLLAEPPAERTLYDIVLQAGETWDVVAPHAVYYRADWTDFGLAHISDLHVARRIDRFRGLLREVGRPEAADRLISWNDRFRGFVRYANRLHAAGELDVIVATGDLIDYQFEDDDDRSGLGNAGFLRDLVLGRAPGPDFPDVEELRVPILMTPGNHDYRIHPYHLVLDIELADIDVKRIRNFSGLGITEKEAMALTNALSFPRSDSVPNLGQSACERMVRVDPTLRPVREALVDPEPHVVELGPHRIVMLDSAHDVGMVTSIMDAIRAWWGSLEEDEANFVGGSPNCEGISQAEYAATVAALDGAPDHGVVMLGVHAPLVNVWNGEYPYFLRETQRTAQADQAWWYVARHSQPLYHLDRDDVRREHKEWFARAGEPEPAYLKRGDTADLLDFGVSRGRAEDLIRALTGETARRPADVVLAGHTHAHNELVVRRLEDGTPAWFLDFYTQNPRAYYPSRVLTDAAPGSSGPEPRPYRLSTAKTYVEVDPEAVPHANPSAMPWDAKHDLVLRVPEYADPLDRTSDPAAWWGRHRPLMLQTGALGILENDQVSFTGFRLLTVRGNVVRRVHFLPSERLERAGWDLPLAVAAAVDPLPRHRHRERSRRFGSPSAQGSPVVVSPGMPATHSVVYRDDDGYLNELWDVPGSVGAGRLADRSVTPAAVGRATSYTDPGGTNVVAYRAADDGIHTLYWRSTEAAGHDALSATAGAPSAAGNPTAFALGGGSHVLYRSHGGHLEDLVWFGTEPVSHARITGYAGEPLAAGDPCGYAVPAAGQVVVAYRGVDAHIHTLYWSEGPTGHDDLSGYTGWVAAAGDPVGYYLPGSQAHQVVYRGTDQHLHEIWWVGASPASAWDLMAASGAPAAASDPACWYVPETNTKHVVYVGWDGHLHELAWPPGGAMTWTDLTVAALAPPAAPDRPAGFSLPGSGTRRVVYRGTDGHVHEIFWD